MRDVFDSIVITHLNYLQIFDGGHFIVSIAATRLKTKTQENGLQCDIRCLHLRFINFLDFKIYNAKQRSNSAQRICH